MRPQFRSSLLPARVLLVSSLFFLIAAAETAQAQVATLSATSYSFGNVAEDSTSTGENVTLHNTSTTTALSITSVVSSGNFAETNTCGTSLAAGRSCTITITFTPTALGAQTGSIVITDNATPATQTITLRGTGVLPITITPASRNFGSVGEGTTSAASTFTVRNYQTTAAPLTISTTAPFAETNTCGTSLAASSTCTISTTFAPTTAGAQSGSITVAYTGVGSPQTATLTGTGVTPITITPTSRSFGSVTQGATSAAKTFALKNGTTAAIAVTVSSTNSEFAATGCTSVAAGSTCNLSVTFTPTATATGAQSANIDVAYTGGGSPQVVSVTGTAVSPLTVSPTSIAFSTTRNVGTASVVHTVTITNRSTSAVVLGSIVASPAAYAITANTCTSSLAANSSCTVSIVFTPTVEGTTIGTLTITYGSANDTIVVNMTGGAQVTRLQSIAITAPDASLPAGQSEQLTATGTYANGTTGNLTSVAVWSSSNPALATVVSSTGVVAGVAAGSPTITAKVTQTNGTTVTSPATTITVTGKSLTAITLTGTLGSTTPIAPPGLAAGTTLQVYATGTYSDGSTQDITQTATWASSNTGATVAGGLITAVSVGTPSISASLSGITGSTTATVTAATLVSIAITPATATVSAGASQQFTATGRFTNGTTQNITTSVTWTPTGPGVSMSTTTPGLALTTNGSAGTNGTISAAMGTVTAATSATLTVSSVALVSVAVTPANQSIPKGTTETFTATGTYSDGSTQNSSGSVTWSATTTGGAVTFGTTTGTSTNVVATATVQGAVTITASVGAITGSTTLTVTAPVLTSIVVSLSATNPAQATEAQTYQGQTLQFYAVGTYSDSSTQNITSTVAWSTGGAAVATISNTTATAGLATGVGPGTVGITATSGSIVSATTGGDGSLTVIGLNSITVTPAAPTAALGDANTADPYGATNNTLQFTATGNFADGTTGPGPVTTSATWTSGTTGVATIGGATGLATLLTAGTSTITATYAGVSGTTLLTVSPATLESFAVCLGAYPSTTCGTSTTSVGATLGLNATQQFSAVGTYSDGSTANLTNSATWTALSPQEVTVSATGLATVVATDNGANAITASYGSFAGSQDIDTAWITASSTAPISCPTPTIGLQLLVVNNAEANGGAGYADFPAIQQILNYVGAPYTVVDVSAAAPTLSSGCTANYQGVIFAYGGDYYNIPTWQSALISFEQTFNLRQLNWYDAPDSNFGFNPTGVSQIPDTETYTTNFTSAAAPIFFYANLTTPLTITNAAVDLATALSPLPSGAVFTPLLQDANSEIVSATYSYNGQQFLTQTFDSNPYLTHDLVVAYGLLNWVTQGVFLGDYHVYATQQVDDNFINDAEWIPSTPCLTTPGVGTDRTLPDASNLPVFRANSNDMAQLAAWQTTKQADPLLSPGTTYETSANSGKFELTLAMNGVGTTGNGDWTGLVAPIVSSSATGGVATFTTQDFSGQVGDTVTISNTTNGKGVLNGNNYTITSVTLSAATTPGTNTFTVANAAAGTLAQASENGADGNSTTATVSEADSLVANLQQFQQYFHWISHTYDHPGSLNGLCQTAPGSSTSNCGNTIDTGDDIELEVLANLYVASASGGVNLDTLNNPCSGGGSVGYCDTVAPLTFTDFNPANIVTPGVTGLNDPNVPGYLYGYGIRYAVSDTSVATTTAPPNNNGPNPSPNVGIVNSFQPLLYEVPRHPNDIFYNVANWGENQAEFDCIYTYYTNPVTGVYVGIASPFNTYNAAQILDFVSTSFVNNMLMGDMDPEMFHQPDLHFSNNYANLTNPSPSGTIPASVTSFLGTGTTHVSSLLSDTYDLTFSKYAALYKLPVLTPTLDQMGVLMQNRNSFNLAGVTASITGSQITITMPPATSTSPSTAVIPVTGLNATGYEVYGGQNISHINMTPGTTITFTLP